MRRQNATENIRKKIVINVRDVDYILLHKWCGHLESSDCVATCYRMNGPGIEFQWRRDFKHPSRPAADFTQLTIPWLSGPFPGVRGVGDWRWPSTPHFTACCTVNFTLTFHVNDMQKWWKVVYVFKLDASSLSTNRWLWAVILPAIN